MWVHVCVALDRIRSLFEEYVFFVFIILFFSHFMCCLMFHTLSKKSLQYPNANAIAIANNRQEKKRRRKEYKMSGTVKKKENIHICNLFKGRQSLRDAEQNINTNTPKKPYSNNADFADSYSQPSTFYFPQTKTDAIQITSMPYDISCIAFGIGSFRFHAVPFSLLLCVVVAQIHLAFVRRRGTYPIWKERMCSYTYSIPLSVALKTLASTS